MELKAQKEKGQSTEKEGRCPKTRACTVGLVLAPCPCGRWQLFSSRLCSHQWWQIIQEVHFWYCCFESIGHFCPPFNPRMLFSSVARQTLGTCVTSLLCLICCLICESSFPHRPKTGLRFIEDPELLRWWWLKTCPVCIPASHPVRTGIPAGPVTPTGNPQQATEDAWWRRCSVWSSIRSLNCEFKSLIISFLRDLWLNWLFWLLWSVHVTHTVVCRMNICETGRM